MPWSSNADYFTEKFWKDHIIEGTVHSKKNAEETFQRRDNIDVSTMIEGSAVPKLIGEIIKLRRNGTYAASPNKPFTSENLFYFWERSGKRARRLGPFKLKYNVRFECGLYKICHFAGVA